MDIMENKWQIVKPSVISDEDFIVAKELPPTVNDIMKVIEKGTYKYGRLELLSDALHCGAIAISNQFDPMRAPERQTTYEDIMGKYDRSGKALIQELFSMFYSLLSKQIYSNVGFDEYLGRIYMLSDTNSKSAGQFFTPYSISKLCSTITIGAKDVDGLIKTDEVLTLNEPTCGSGGMILAAADVLYNQYRFNISRNLLAVCADIDARCVHMAYLQLSLAGIPAIIYHQDTLRMKCWDTWITPACIMQWPRFQKALKKSIDG